LLLFNELAIPLALRKYCASLALITLFGREGAFLRIVRGGLALLGKLKVIL
jgi:hypothetical protein